MEVKDRSRKRIAAIFAVGLLAGAVGCDRELAALTATTWGSFLGEVVSVLATRWLESTLGVESQPSAEEEAHQHEHGTTALHEHEH